MNAASNSREGEPPKEVIDASQPARRNSRAIASEKANTANALSLPEFALSSANLCCAAQPGATLHGPIAAHPPATAEPGAEQVPAGQIQTAKPWNYTEPMPKAGGKPPCRRR